VDDYRSKDFEFVSIETWSNNLDGLRRYQQKNGLTFKFLKSNEDVTEAYGITSVPVFFIIDENRIIREVVSGYAKDQTDSIIVSIINSLI
jgi:thioredoxin-related protein